MAVKQPGMAPLGYQGQYYDASMWQGKQSMPPIPTVFGTSQAVAGMALPGQQHMQQCPQAPPAMAMHQLPQGPQSSAHLPMQQAQQQGKQQQSPSGMMFMQVMMMPVWVNQEQQHQQQQFGQYQYVEPPTFVRHTGERRGSDSESTDVPSTDVPSPRSRSSDDEPESSRRRWTAGSVQVASPMARIAQNFSLLASKSFGDDRSYQVMSSIEQNMASDVELCWPDMGVRVKGQQSVQAFSQCFLSSMSDLEMSIEAVTEDGPSCGMIEYTVSGTQSRPVMPMFPVGKWVQWRIYSRYEFDQAMQVRVHQVRFGFVPNAPVTSTHFLGLAGCARMLASTSGGSRLLQEAIEMSPDITDVRNKEFLLSQMQSHVWEMSLSLHGNHVVQKLIMNLFPHQLQFIVDEFRGHVVEAAQNQMQSRVLERLFEYGTPMQTAGLAEEALRQAPLLLRHSFGNFVLQGVLDYGLPEHRSRLVRAIARDAERLARHKIASNTVRKALRSSAPADQEALVEALRSDPRGFQNLCKHKTGSFVARELKHLGKGFGPLQ